MPSRPWFKAKHYGWGWYPATWQGWLALAAYGAIVAADVFVMRRYALSVEAACIGMLVVILSSLALTWLAYRTGEKPRWRWGND